jgi:deoxyribodipyrimidine photolyase
MFYDNFVSYYNSVSKSPSAVASELGLSWASDYVLKKSINIPSRMRLQKWKRGQTGILIALSMQHEMQHKIFLKKIAGTP